MKPWNRFLIEDKRSVEVESWNSHSDLLFLFVKIFHMGFEYRFLFTHINMRKNSVHFVCSVCLLIVNWSLMPKGKWFLWNQHSFHKNNWKKTITLCRFLMTDIDRNEILVRIYFNENFSLISINSISPSINLQWYFNFNWFLLHRKWYVNYISRLSLRIFSTFFTRNSFFVDIIWSQWLVEKICVRACYISQKQYFLVESFYWIVFGSSKSLTASLQRLSPRA